MNSVILASELPSVQSRNQALPLRPTTGEAAWLSQAMIQVTLGDYPAFQDIYQRTSARLLGICLRILPDRAEAEDALQKTYSIVWRRAALYDKTRGTVMTWMITIARNQAIDRLHCSGRISTLPFEIADHIADEQPLAFEILAADQEVRRLSDSLATIKPLDAMLIRTAFLEGLTYAELAQRTGIPLGTIKGRARRALPKLRSFLI